MYGHLSPAALTRERLAPHKTHKHWITVDEFPLTGSGKIQKYVLRQRWEDGLGLS